MEILPAIIPRSLKDFEDKAFSVKGLVKHVHVDMCDGFYVKAQGWPYNTKWSDFDKFVNQDDGLPGWEVLDYEVHLMVRAPLEAIDKWILAGATSFVIQAENLTDNFDDIEKLVHGSECKLGISFLPKTNISDHTEWINKSDFVQCMGIRRIGFQGEEFDDNVFEQIKIVKEINPDILISVDGHVDTENIKSLAESGVEKFIVGSAIFGSESIPQAIEDLQTELEYNK